MNVKGLFDSLVSHVLTLGQYDRVSSHEPKNAPGNGLTAAVFFNSTAGVPDGSGLAATTARVEFVVRSYSNMLQEPQDEIDPNVLIAVDALMTAYSGDFSLGGTIRNVDLLGQAGPGLRSQAGYQTIDKTMFRVVDVFVPLIVNDAWVQAA